MWTVITIVAYVFVAEVMYTYLRRVFDNPEFGVKDEEHIGAVCVFLAAVWPLLLVWGAYALITDVGEE